MSEMPDDDTGSQQPELDDAGEREQIARTQDELDAEADRDGLAAEAGAGEENGLAEG